MIKITDKTDCCGCTACASVCPKQCIRMKPDEDGFVYPEVDAAACIRCGSCIRVCPVRNQEKKPYPADKTKEEITAEAVRETVQPSAYVCFYQDDDVRRHSTSGGMFTALARYVLDKGGRVYGAGFDEHFAVRHASADTLEGLAAFRGSKYVQSSQEHIYREVRQTLESGRWVLYTGTPCQVAGLKRFLPKAYDTLVTADLFCHGVGSPRYWKRYLEEMTGKYRSPVREVRFREKTYGYNSTCMALYFENGKSSHRDHDQDLYLSPFSKCFLFRPSCYACAFKTLRHESDFSIGDYWQTAGLEPAYEKAEGCTLLLCHSENGRRILEAVRDTLTCTEVPLEQALLVNGGHQPSMLITSSRKPAHQEAFLTDSRSAPIRSVVRQYMPLSFKTKLKCFVKPVLYKTGVLKTIKKVRRK